MQQNTGMPLPNIQVILALLLAFGNWGFGGAFANPAATSINSHDERGFRRG